MRRAFPRVVAVLTLLILAGSVPAWASSEAPSSRGFSPDQVYHINGIDSVNDFTGNLEVTIPIGPVFKTNGSLTYSFSLHYHSNLWDYEEYEGQDGRPLGGKPSLWDRRPPIDAFPILDFNAGLGWRLSVGGHPKRHPYSGVVSSEFVTESGAEHAMFGSPVDSVLLAQGVSYSNDGTYLRMTVNGLSKTVEYPDGTRERFVCLAQCGTIAAWYELDQRSDPFGDVLYVTRDDQPSGQGQNWTWTYHEAVGEGPYPDHESGTPLTEVRTHTMVLTRDSRMTGGYRISTITLASAGPGNQAVYTFGYTNADIIRPYTHNFTGTPTVPFGLVAGNRMPLVLLTSITGPPNADNSPSSDWAFSYIVDPNTTDYPGDVTTSTTPDGHTTWQVSHYSGLIETVTLPTKGQYRYKYKQRFLDKFFCFGGPEAMNQTFSATAVRERAILKPDGTLDGDRPWRYFGGSYGILGYQGPRREFMSGVLDPFGTLDVSFFDTFTGDGCAENPGGIYNKFDWGLNLSKEEVDSSGRYLQSRVFQCTNTAPFDAANADAADGAFRRLLPRYLYFPEETLSCGEPLRTTYASWDNDGGFCRGEFLTDCDQRNRRVLSTATVYHDDGDTFTEELHADYDGLGHYRTMKTGGNFWHSNYPNITGGDERILFTNYNPGVVFLNHTFVGMPNGTNLTNLPWLLETYDLQKTKQAKNGQAGGPNPQVSSTLYLFDPVTGLLKRQRRLRRSVDCAWNTTTARADCYDAGSLDAADLLTENVRTQNGVSTSVLSSFFGGDNGALPTAGDLTGPVGDSADYIIRRDFRYGEVESSGYYDCGATNPILLVEQNTIDPHTGLILASADSSGATTAYTYDHLGRYLSADPPGDDAPTNFTYTAAGGGQNAKIDVKTQTATATLRTTTYEFDHLGRLVVQRNQVPGDTAGHLTDSVRYTGYFANGWKTFETTVGPNNAKGSTTYKDFDAFGRARTVIQPDNGTDGKTSKTTFIFNGVRSTVETVHGLALGSGNGNGAQVSKSYDRFGNLSKISESSGAGGADARTRYEYDNLDHLTLVDSPNGQSRTFSYDMRGFLLSETYPELAGRTMRHLGYDARGNVHQRVLSQANEPATPFDLKLDYDGAERVISVTQSSTGHALKGFTYFPQSGTTPPLSAGKLRRAVRDNFVPPVSAPAQSPADTPVTLEYGYDGGTGRLSSRTTTVSGLGFTTSFTYDKLGNVASIAYPPMSGRCVGCPLFGPARTVTFTYKEGRLFSIPSFVSSVTYHANGMPASVSHSNGSVDYYDVDPNYLARPSAIRTTFPQSATWTTGAYKYDAAGNVSAIGASQTYAYDKVGRLVRATLSNTTQTFGYDENGNLTNLPGTPATSNSMPLNRATNRLSSTNATYDLAGNLTTWIDPRDNSTAVHDYDSFGLITHNRGAGQGKIYLYDANNERTAVFDYGTAGTTLRETWSVRGVNNEILRDVTRTRSITPGDPGSWTWSDYVYRGTSLLARIQQGSPEVVQHVHVDHLGSIRRTSNAAGAIVDSQEFYPFGDEIDDRPDDNRIKFTGQERDSSTNPLAHLDYMHARYYTPSVGRFLSVDPVIPTSSLRAPQRWNRYAYAMNNPIHYVDPTGKDIVLSGCVRDAASTACRDQLAAAKLAFGRAWSSVNYSNGVITLKSGVSPLALGKMYGPVAHTLGFMAKSPDHFNVIADAGKAAQGGGAYTERIEGGGANIYYDATKLGGSRTVPVGEVNAGLAEVLAHESGHATEPYFASIQAINAKYGALQSAHEAFPVFLENAWRRMEGGHADNDIRVFYGFQGDIAYPGTKLEDIWP